MTPRGECPSCNDGRLAALEAAPGWVRCPACCLTYDSLGNVYDRDWRPTTAPLPRRQRS